MILCVTPNPAVDRTLVVPGFAHGGVFRTQEYLVAAGGKGVNVARAVQTLGQEAVCAGFLGGFSGQSVAAMVQRTGLDACWTWLPGRETRTCVILVDPESAITSVLNEPGPQLTAADWTPLRADLLQAAGDVSVISFSGSLPPGSPSALFAALLADLVTMGKQVWVDTSSTALEAALQVRGVFLKVNDEEAAALMNRPIHTPADAVAAARQMMTKTRQPVVITLGKQGAVWVDGGQAWLAIPPVITGTGSVGSGDSFLAGLLVALANGAAQPAALGQGVAAGTANAHSLGSACFTRQDFESVMGQIQIIDGL